MLNPPAKLLGINGILKFSNEILKWDKFSSDKLKLSGITNYFQISKDGGTGGGIFREMYGNFLIEAALILENERINRIGNDFLEIAKQWDRIAEYLWKLGLNGGISLLRTISDLILNIYKQEKKYINVYKIVFR